MKFKVILKNKNPSSMWKLGKIIEISFGEAGIVKFECVKDDRGEDYFYCEKANYSYHRRLFNKKMPVAHYEKIFTQEEMAMKIRTKILDADIKKQKLVSALIDVCDKDKYEISEVPGTNLLEITDANCTTYEVKE